MNKQRYPFLHETYCVDTTKDGLTLIFIEKKGFKNSSFYLAIPYGSLDYRQEMEGNVSKNSLGIAHFLEHQLFENNEGMDIMEAFSHLGANVNAFTSHTETVYTFSSSKKTLTKELNLLLDFVQQLNITPASVEKEKGIIVQELNMYMQMPEQRLVYETYQSLYHEHPIRFDIGGTEQSVNSTRYEELIDVFERNYHPSRSILVCISPLPVEKLRAIVLANQNAKTFKKPLRVKRCDYDEPEAVHRSFYEFNMDIQNSKCTYSYKLNLMTKDNKENLRIEWGLRLLCELKFSPLNPHYEEWLKRNLIHDYFGYEVECNTDYSFVLFYLETEDHEGFRTLIRNELMEDISHLLPYLDALKRRYFSSMIRSLDDHDDYAVTWIRSYFQTVPFEYQFEVLKTIDANFLRELQKQLQQSPNSLVKMTHSI